MFLWKLSNSGLPLFMNLMARGVQVESNRCVHGCDAIESEVHVFFHCEVAKCLRFAIPWNIRWDMLEATAIKDFLFCLANPVGVLPVQEADEETFFALNAITLEHL
ncbi:hypothetical protein FEM48_Zijuj07G0061500 [Ziziphus jujuba var. spinosa]|uniref:Reverse transcriptase zinc-binding domain-containing protein n=1 Tax=Ziziphus jujuba var. spinosa TaxID=714518 RepID=A0A978V2X6_ZIZJJ|nr:hypothetical protein FEM48_Zijuj07G0061500 [Ziziphus jujuba var. spinosa]